MFTKKINEYGFLVVKNQVKNEIEKPIYAEKIIFLYLINKYQKRVAIFYSIWNSDEKLCKN